MLRSWRQPTAAGSIRSVLAAAILAVLIRPVPAAAEPFEFMVLGDIPYNDAQIANLEGYLGDKIREAGVPFLIHYGDIKSGDGACSDELMEERLALLAGLIAGGAFYTPGDNDWTDCDRLPADIGGLDELERLDFLRRLFFAETRPSNPDWEIAWQAPDFPENARWRAGGLVFATVHVVGTDNGREEILKTEPKSLALDAADARDAANIAWLEQAFATARDTGAEGLVVAMQADPGELWHPDARLEPCTPERRSGCNPYLTFLESLTGQAAAFGKPVLLVHGSTNSYCMERRYGGWRAPNLWRLNGPGDFVTVDAAIVRFDPEARSPFEAWGLLSKDPPVDCWPRGG